MPRVFIYGLHDRAIGAIASSEDEEVLCTVLRHQIATFPGIDAILDKVSIVWASTSCMSPPHVRIKIGLAPEPSRTKPVKDALCRAVGGAIKNYLHDKGVRRHQVGKIKVNTYDIDVEAEGNATLELE